MRLTFIFVGLFSLLVAPLGAGFRTGSEPSFLQESDTTKRPDPQPRPSIVGGGRSRAQPATPGAAPPSRARRAEQPPSVPQARPEEPPADAAPPADTSAQQPDPGPQPEERTPRARPARRGQGMAFAFSNAAIEDVVATIMKELGLSYVIDPDVSGTVNVYTHGELPRERLFQILEQLLNMNGQAIVKQDDFYVILPLNQGSRIPGRILLRPAPAKPAESPTESESKAEPSPAAPPQPPPTAAAQRPAPSPTTPQQPTPQQPSPPAVRTLEQSQEAEQLEEEEGVITYIIPLSYIPSSEMVTMIKAFVSEGAQIVDFQTANIVILTDYRANVQQALNLIQLLDTRYFDINQVDLVPVRYHQAVDVAEDLGKVFAPGDKAGGVRIVAIERLNSILVVTHSPAVLQEVMEWIGKLDAPSTGSNIRTFVYQVENNTATNIAEILAQLYEDGAGLPSGPVDETQEGRPQVPARRQEPGFLPEGRGGQFPSLGPSLSGRSAPGGVRAVVSGNIKIIVNEYNNSLIIQGTEADYRFLEQTIKQLDVLPRQALIEAKIYSVELRNELSFGVAAFLQARDSAADLPPATVGSISAPGEGSSGGIFSAATRIIIGGERQLDLLVNALRSRTNVEIVEAPSLLVLDGTEAQINVGAEVPVTTASFGDPLRSGTETAFVNSIQFRPTGTTLLMLPRITASGIVTMDLAIEVSSATGTGLTPTINRNFVRTSMIARDNETVAIAGVISDQLSLGRERVPVLGDIPVLGALFGQTSRNKRRFELLFTITPRVIRNFPTAVELTLDFKRALRGAYDFIERKEEEEKALKERRRREEQQKREEKNSSRDPG